MKQIDRRSHSGVEDEPFAAEESKGVESVIEGRYQEALAIFQKIESEHPGHYNTAANLGTTYELLGENEEALKWIGEGVRRNPEAHGGTEWLHLAILEAKVKLKKDPAYLTHSHIIDVPENLRGDSKIEVQGKSYPLFQVFNALEYQLHERLYFVRTPDPVVADLLFSFSQLEARIFTLESAVGMLEMARSYGYPDAEALDAKIEEYQSVMMFRKIKVAAWIAAAVLGFVSFLVFAYRKKWFFLSGEAYRRHLEEKERLRNEDSMSGAGLA
ncbi:tetratricopeptide repeat protein [Luteolibacter flavescens]|uniref:Tetratricopeptide repeat protein n=1 Tax=Luteolibacter flavescens TaxID=1859460 RepID=A0ABT3FWF8_9BACT|nr:tetratricopeptide repeat protein [Luteolibacter flavescens]MCW1887737.1 tetratricopeptide repeat protein [Luteolibacter flavescens]